MRVTPARLLILATFAAIVVFCLIQDRITAAAAGQYVVLQQAAAAGTGPAVTIDEVMRPAVRRSVRQGAAWGLTTFAVGMAAAALWTYSRNRRPT